MSIGRIGSSHDITYIFSMQTLVAKNIWNFPPKKIWIVGRNSQIVFYVLTIILTEEKFLVAISQPQHGIAPYSNAIITYFPSIIIKENFSTKIMWNKNSNCIAISQCISLPTKYSSFWAPLIDNMFFIYFISASHNICFLFYLLVYFEK